MNASIVDLRYNMKDVLRAIDRGETVTVLYRGKAKAKLMPMRSPRKPPAADRPEPRTSPSSVFGGTVKI